MRLFFEVYGLALRDPDRFRGFLDSVVADWLALLEERARQEGVPAERARATATLLVATYRGLAFDLLATGDRERVQAAHLELKRWLRLAADDREADEGVESASDSP
jgi:hypothetical protein